MLQRGRRSATSYEVPNVNGKPRRLSPPSTLTNPEQTLFSELVAACAPEHFRESDLPLLVSFVQATLLARDAITRAADEAAALSTWERAVKVQAMLGTKLRLTPQARIDPKTLGRQQPQQFPPPWLLPREIKQWQER